MYITKDVRDFMLILKYVLYASRGLFVHIIYLILVIDHVIKIIQKMGLSQVEQGFSSFFANFLAYLMIFQYFTAPLASSTLKNHQIYQIIDKKNEVKSCSTCLLKPFFTALPKPETQVLDTQSFTICPAI